MAARKSGLGKGLESLIPVQRPDRGYTTVPLDQIEPNPHQPRTHFDDESLEELAASIREVGVLQPAIVRQSAEGRYTLIAGERRWRAARLAGMAELPVIVRDTDESAILTEALIENVQRENLSPLEEAAGYQDLLEDHGMTHEEVGQRVGKSRTAITNSLRLLTLPPAVQGLLERQAITAGHGRALAGLDDAAYATHIAQRAADEGWSVRQIEDAVRARLGGGGQAKLSRVERGGGRPASRPAEVLELESRLAGHLDAPVRIDYGRRGGKIVVKFRDLDALQRLYVKLFGG